MLDIGQNYLGGGGGGGGGARVPSAPPTTQAQYMQCVPIVSMLGSYPGYSL